MKAPEDILAPVIPRIFHRIWVGSNPIPDEFAAYGESWESLHPDWEMRQWTEDNLPELLRPEGADPRRDPTERSDLLRYELVRRFGGVYLDMDFECLKPIDELVEGVDFFVGYVVSDEFGEEARRRVGSAIIGAVPGHTILERAIREAEPRPDFTYDKDATGPLFLERLLQDFPDATRFPLEYLYPQTPEHEESAYAIHHEARAWLSHDELNDIVKSQRRKMRSLKKRIWRLEQRQAEARRELEESERRRRELKAELAAARSGFASRVRGGVTQLRARAQRS
jgi:mannosyltransferase OCH1-like enzyme